MDYRAKDGKRFSNSIQGRRYDESLAPAASHATQGRADFDKAPGGNQHEHFAKIHGPARRITIEAEGNGRHRVTVVHSDGERSTSVHPEGFRAFQVGQAAYGISDAPPAVQTHQRARAQPIGPKEDERLKHEDQRVVEEDESV